MRKRNDRAPRVKGQDEPRSAQVPSLLHEIATVVALIVLAVALEEAIEHMPFARHLAFASYRFFQEGVTSERTPVAIVDISDLQLENGRTSRGRLQELLLAVVRHGPKVVGVDIDFSPEERRPLDLRDKEFFEFCLRLERATGVPIVLGVDRTTGAPASEWLGAEDYKSLAATMRIPNDTRRIPHSIAGSGASLRSLSAALANAHGRSAAPSAMRLMERAGLIRQFSLREDRGARFEEFLVDYSTLGSHFPVRTVSPVVLGDRAFRKPFEGNIVLLGDVESARDMFPVANGDKAHAGVTLHASAAATLVNGPLYEVTRFGRVILSALLISAVLGPVLAVRARARTLRKRFWISGKLQGTLVVTLTVAAILSCGWIVRATHIIWDGFFLAFFVLAFHQPVEDFLHTSRRLFGHVRTGLEAEQ
jgi:CHASE2 domain-containing sensor protein